MFLQLLSCTPLLLTVLIIVIVNENEANTVHRGHTNWWDNSRHRTDPNQRQYLSRTPQGHFNRDQHSTQGQGHRVTITATQSHDPELGRSQGTGRQQRHHQTSQLHSQQSQTHQDNHQRDNRGQSHTSGDNVGQGHRASRDNAGQSHPDREKKIFHSRDNVGHLNRDNVGHHATGDNVRQGHHTKGDNLGQSHHYSSRDKAAQHIERDNVGQSHHATRDNVPQSHRGDKSHANGHTKQIFSYNTQNSKGEGSPQCTYSFVVNELDSSKCPMLLQQLQQQQKEQSNQQHHRPNSQHFQNDQDILSKYYDSLNMNKEIAVLIQRIDTLENKLLREVAKNRELENDILELENKVKRHEKVVDYHGNNITNIATVIKRGEIMQQRQMGYWKNVDTKLSGVMLDVVELNNRLDRQDSIMQLNDEAAKSIYVQSTGQQTCTGIKNATRFKDCEDLYHNGHKRSGVYYITPIYTSCPIPVYCDMETPPGGWLVIQRRMDGSVSFNQTWAQYRNGFGNVGGEYWIGNDNLFLLTNQLHYALRVDLYDFYNSRVYAEYKTFKVDGERDRYMLHVGNHTGTAPDGLGNHDKVRFSTPDQDHDEWMDYHCAKEWAAGWWFNNCWFAILNGPYYNVTDVKYRGISWNDWKSEQLKHVEMKIRPAGF